MEPVPYRYPEALGRWPAAGLLFAFTTLELAYPDSSNPLALAIAIFVYSAITWLGMIAFGRDTWLARGEAFSVYFALLGRIAPLALEREGDERRIVVRPPLAGLSTRLEPRGTVAFVAVMLGSVAFDGFSRTSWWADEVLEIQYRYALDPGRSDLLVTAFNLSGLLGAVALVALAYLAAVRLARSVAGARRQLAQEFVGGLVPIALGYAVAHYLSLFLVGVQWAWMNTSDPFGFGWDIFGTATFQPQLTVLSPNATWYAQAAALVVGHVLGLAVAHDRAISIFRSPAAALRSQYPLLLLMVAYTVTGLWLLSQ